jgi:hypothetical protein
MLAIVVTSVVLKNGTDLRAVQPLNIPLISVTRPVSKNGQVVKEEHAANIFFIVVTLLVLNCGT